MLAEGASVFLLGCLLAELAGTRRFASSRRHVIGLLAVAVAGAGFLLWAGFPVAGVGWLCGVQAASMAGRLLRKTRLHWRIRLICWTGLALAAEQWAAFLGASELPLIEMLLILMAAAAGLLPASLAPLFAGRIAPAARTIQTDSPALQLRQLDAALPQLQCGRCGYPGCLAYAKAMAAGAPVNRCAPGGSEVMRILAAGLEEPARPVQQWRGDGMALNAVAVIRESECIGCTKCIQACPTDAIVGGRQTAHAVIAARCTGCDLCLPVCPTDCIDLVEAASPFEPDDSRRNFAVREQRRLQPTDFGPNAAPVPAKSEAAPPPAATKSEIARPPGAARQMSRAKTEAALKRALRAGNSAAADSLRQALARMEAEQTETEQTETEQAGARQTGEKPQ